MSHAIRSDRTSLYRDITNKIIAELEEGRLHIVLGRFAHGAG